MMMLNVDTDSTTCHAYVYIYIFIRIYKSIHGLYECMYMMCPYVLDICIFFIAHLENIGLYIQHSTGYSCKVRQNKMISPLDMQHFQDRYR